MPPMPFILGVGDKSVRWYFNFDGVAGHGPYAEFSGTTLHPVGFTYQIQDEGNTDPALNRAELIDNGDGTYTLKHGLQIFNPQYDNPRAGTITLFRITQVNERDLQIETLDNDGDGIPGKQIFGVFPMTVSPEFVGSLTRYPADNNADGVSDYDAMQVGLNPYSLDTDGDGVTDRLELEILPGNLVMSQPRDSDFDGVIDALEPGAYATDNQVAGYMPLLNGVYGYKTSLDRFSGAGVTLYTGAHVGGGADTALQFSSRLYTNTYPNYRTGVLSTGPMAIQDNAAANPESGKPYYGQPGLSYEYGYTRFTVLPDHFNPVVTFDAWDPAGQCTASLALPANVPAQVTVRLRYTVALPPQDKLLVYAEELGSFYLTTMPSDFTLLDKSAWQRIDDHTLQVTLPFASARNTVSLYMSKGTCAQIGSGTNTYLRVGDLQRHAFVGAIAPVENTLGGFNTTRDLSVSGGGGGGSLGLGGLLVLLLAGLLSVSLPARAQQAPAQEGNDAESAASPARAGALAPIQVRGIRQSEPKGHIEVEIQREILEKVPGATNLIDLSKYKGSQSSLAQVLDAQPGIIVQEFFGGNDQPRVNIRGSGIQDNPVSRGIQLLYDGLPINQADGSFIMGLMDPEQSRYVSVYRGANAMRYGATTLGGAIDFGMRTGRNTEGSYAQVETGTWGLRKSTLALGRQSGDWDFYAQGSYSESEGWRDHSKSKRSNLSANVGKLFDWGENRTYLHLADNHFDIPFLLSKEQALKNPRSVLGDGDTKFDEYMDIRKRKPWRDTQQLRLANKTTLELGDTRQTLGIYGERILDELKNPVSLEKTVAVNVGLDYGFEWNHTREDGRLTQVLGFLSANTGRMPRAFDVIAPSDGRLLLRVADLDMRASNMVGGMQLLHEFLPGWQAVAAVQYAYNERKITDLINPGVLDSTFQFSALNPKLGLIWKLDENRRIYANVSGSSEAPTFWQLASISQNAFVPIGSYVQIADLKMQTAKTYEIGMVSESEALSWEAAYYYARVHDELISEVGDFAIDGTTVNYNYPTTHQGVELAFNLRTPRGVLLDNDRFNFRGVYNWSDFTFDGGRYDGKRVAGVPEHLIFGELGYEIGERWYFGLNARWQPTPTYVDHSNSGLQLDDYLLLSARASWKPRKDVEMFLNLNNLLGTQYQTAYVVRGFSPDDPSAPTFVPGLDFHWSAGIKLRW